MNIYVLIAFSLMHPWYFSAALMEIPGLHKYFCI